jgi:hypothetical protein
LENVSLVFEKSDVPILDMKGNVDSERFMVTVRASRNFLYD